MEINDKEYWSYVKVININLDFIYVYPFHVILYDFIFAVQTKYCRFKNGF